MLLKRLLPRSLFGRWLLLLMAPIERNAFGSGHVTNLKGKMNISLINLLPNVV